MGLGKSVQTTALIAGLFHSDMINAALIVAPVSVLPVWEDAFKKFAPELRVRTYHGASVPERVKAMRAVQTKGGVLITSYGMISSDPVAFGGRPVADDDAGSAGAAAAGGAGAGAGAAAGKKGAAKKPAATPSAQLGDLDISFDMMVLDEAHTIKNTATKAARALRTVPADFRFLLTVRWRADFQRLRLHPHSQSQELFGVNMHSLPYIPRSALCVLALPSLFSW